MFVLVFRCLYEMDYHKHTSVTKPGDLRMWVAMNEDQAPEWFWLQLTMIPLPC